MVKEVCGKIRYLHAAHLKKYLQSFGGEKIKKIFFLKKNKNKNNKRRRNNREQKISCTIENTKRIMN